MDPPPPQGGINSCFQKKPTFVFFLLIRLPGGLEGDDPQVLAAHRQHVIRPAWMITSHTTWRMITSHTRWRMITSHTTWRMMKNQGTIRFIYVTHTHTTLQIQLSHKKWRLTTSHTQHGENHVTHNMVKKLRKYFIFSYLSFYTVS